MSITNKVVELYTNVTAPGYVVSMKDVIYLAQLRKSFFKTVELTRPSQVGMFKQLLKEAKGGFRLSPLHFLTMDNKLLQPLEKQRATEQIQSEFKALMGRSINDPHEALERLLPLCSISDFTRTLHYMFCFISAQEKLHVVKHDPPPPV